MSRWVLGLFTWLVVGLGMGVVYAADGPAHRTIIKPRDTILFVGDSLVADSAWTREVGAGVLRVRSGEQVRTYTASWAGAIIAGGAEEAGRGRGESALLWVPRVTLSTRPTVLVMAFGWDDALRRGGAEGEAFESRFEAGLEAVVGSVRQRVRELFLVTPPADGPEGTLTDRERARLAGISGATLRVAARHGVKVVALHEGGAREGLSGAWDAASGVRLEGAPSVVAASHVLEGLGFSGAELSRVGWAPCSEPVFERAREHLAMEVHPAEGERSRTFRVAGALASYDQDFDVLWRQLEMRLAVTNEHRVDMLGWQRMEVERNWLALERIVTASEETDSTR